MPNKVIELFMGEPLHGDEPEAVTIMVCKKLPPLETTINNVGVAQRIFEGDAKLLTEALFKALPQGTSDRLLYEIMGKKLTLYRGIARQ